VVGPRTRIGGAARVRDSVLWEDAVVEPGARVERSVVVGGGVVRHGERALNVIVMPAASLAAGSDAGAPVEGHGDMVWVEIQ
jgi:NDP-sugar pyrophosphorylase family protein